jgi:hypothetical protein
LGYALHPDRKHRIALKKRPVRMAKRTTNGIIPVAPRQSRIDAATLHAYVNPQT